MTTEIVLLLLFCFIVKHFLFDFPIQTQTPWMFLNKGKYGHPGGIVHASIHSYASFIIMLLFSVYFGLQTTLSLPTVALLITFEFFVHYHMDWFKVWYGTRKGWTPQTPQFWTFLGIDQMVHYLTYLAMIWWLV